MAPLCLLAYLAYRAAPGSTLGLLREELELVTLLFQLCGTIWFVGPELLTECRNMVPIGVAGCLPGTKPYELMYFWFAVGVNVVWVLVPLVMIVAAMQRNAALKAQAATPTSKKAKRA
eukprot:g8265.t1